MHKVNGVIALVQLCPLHQGPEAASANEHDSLFPRSKALKPLPLRATALMAGQAAVTSTPGVKANAVGG